MLNSNLNSNNKLDNILILCPTNSEYRTLLSYINKLPKKHITVLDYIEVVCFELNSKHIYLAHSFVGKTNTALTIGLLKEKLNIQGLIIVGAAGTLNKEIHQYDVVICEKSCYWDVDLTSFGLKVGQMDDLPLYFESPIENIRKTLNTSNYNFKVLFGTIITSDRFATHENISKQMISSFDNPLCAEMELASCAQCAYLLKIPFYGVKSISDEIREDNNNKEQYVYDRDIAEKNSIQVLFDILKII